MIGAKPIPMTEVVNLRISFLKNGTAQTGSFAMFLYGLFMIIIITVIIVQNFAYIIVILHLLIVQIIIC